MSEQQNKWQTIRNAEGQWIVVKPNGWKVDAGPWSTKDEAEKALGFMVWTSKGGSAD
jgi:hypothetical protein